MTKRFLKRASINHRKNPAFLNSEEEGESEYEEEEEGEDEEVEETEHHEYVVKHCTAKI